MNTTSIWLRSALFLGTLVLTATAFVSPASAAVWQVHLSGGGTLGYTGSEDILPITIPVPRFNPAQGYLSGVSIHVVAAGGLGTDLFFNATDQPVPIYSGSLRASLTGFAPGGLLFTRFDIVERLSSPSNIEIAPSQLFFGSAQMPILETRAATDDFISGLDDWIGTGATAVTFFCDVIWDGVVTGLTNISDPPHFGGAYAGYTIYTMDILYFYTEADYNYDGTVDAADYVKWRKDGGSAEEFAIWRANFGASAGADSALESADSSVPEPATSLLLLWTAAGAIIRRRYCRA